MHRAALEQRPVPPIPTEDAQEALRFCRALAALTAQAAPTATPDPPQLSVVIPAYNEEENLPTLYSRLRAALDPLDLEYEIIFVNDGSRDATLSLLQQMAAIDPRLVVIDLARNFGHQVAISAGLDHSRGRGVIIMDGDLQDPPEVLPEFIAKWREGYDVVYAIREQRKEGWLKRTAYTLFYRLLKQVASIDIPLDAGDFCIMDRGVVDLLNGMPERNRFVRGIRSWIGLRQTGLAYARHARYAGRPKYTLTRLIYLALDGLISFSYLPLRMISLAGVGVSIMSILIAIFYTIQKLTVGLSPPGFATLVVATFFLAGIQLITIGVIGEYVGRIFEEVKGRPLYVVRKVWGRE
ncbi:glycosyl transferase family protein [Oscillochloris trichoides DG-6]|uniref:Glycosyl transferase family protein n=1 Tax=Oscillochloris trichoides DG-6 TaxID=765420 RepID=E1IC22_9CHLR|nr:glycosyltransferase family 2 protein [Oscillochloris trichoides]EFO81284.1 glycosyl transferase family protein [Oscillochloris trichoides DG-6]